MKESISQKSKRWLNDKEYRFIYSRVPRLCVDILIFTEDGFILTKRGIPPYRGTWHFPGGGVLYREHLDKAINRLASTEVGVSVKKLTTLGYCEVVKEEHTFRHSVSIVFAVKIRSGSLRESEQARKIKSFKRIPSNTIPEQGKFMRKHWREIKKIMDSRKSLRK